MENGVGTGGGHAGGIVTKVLTKRSDRADRADSVKGGHGAHHGDARADSKHKKGKENKRQPRWVSRAKVAVQRHLWRSIP